MSKALITESSLTNIGNAIRAKLGVQTTYKPNQMPDAIMSIPSKLGTKNITTNGTWAASADNLDGYSSVVVNVSGGGGAGRCPRSEQTSQFDYGTFLSTISWTCTAVEQTD